MQAEVGKATVAVKAEVFQYSIRDAIDLRRSCPRTVSSRTFNTLLEMLTLSQSSIAATRHKVFQYSIRDAVFIFGFLGHEGKREPFNTLLEMRSLDLSVLLIILLGILSILY